MITNLPLKVEVIRAYFLSRSETAPTDVARSKWAKLAEEVGERIVAIPEAVCHRWRDADGGPWDEFLAGQDLSGAFILLDEWHNYCGKRSDPVTVRRKWALWLGELRHCGATFMGVSQDPGKLASECEDEAGKRYLVVTDRDRRDKVFYISMYDWAELRAAWTGRWRERTWVIEEIKKAGKWSKNDIEWYLLEPQYFAMYSSHAAPIAGGRAGQEAKKQYERLSSLGVTWWFARRNAVRIAPKAFIITAMLTAGLWFPLAIGVMTKTVAAGVTRSTTAGAEALGGEGESGSEAEAGVASGGKGVAARKAAVEPGKKVAPVLPRVFAMRPDMIWVEGVGEVRMGEAVESGENGKKLERIEYDRGKIVLDNGDVWRVGVQRVQEPVAVTEAAPSADVQPRISTATERDERPSAKRAR